MAAAHGSDTPGYVDRSGTEDDSRARAQLVLGELHRVVRIVDTVSRRMRVCQGRSGSYDAGALNKDGFGKERNIGNDGGPGAYDISPSCLTQLESDLWEI